MEQYCINPDASLLECMQVIQINGAGIALAVNSDFQLVGTVSDGDIRKALIQGDSLKSPILPHINRSCFSVTSSVQRAEVLDIMHARRFEQVPIVDENDKLVGLHLLHDMLGNAYRPNWALVMAGGKGTRLLPVTERVPKPMIKVAGRPILERIILCLVSNGFKKIFISVNHLSEVIEDHFKDGSGYGVEIEYVRETQPLGSGGAISLLPGKPEHPVLVMNGDLVADVNYGEMIEHHTKNGYFATMGVYSYLHQVPYGCVEVSKGRLERLEEKPIIQKMVNAGIYVLSPKAIEAVPRDISFPITDLFEKALVKNLDCGTYFIEKEWIDIGTPDQLRRARGES